MIKSFFIAFSMYSKIPVPQFAWKKEDMKYVFCFFPWVGAVVGALLYVWNQVCVYCGVGVLCRTAVGMAIPLLVTGGFHVDGFMDTMDAIHSYCSKERKLEILKDSHIGAFAVIALAVYGLVWCGAFSEIQNGGSLKIMCCGFFLSRCLCGLSAISFPPAKKEGTLYLFVDGASKKTVKAALCLQGAVCIGFMCYLEFAAGLAALMAAVLSYLFYYERSRRAFGGITGDTAGYFVLLSEECMAAALAVYCVVF